MRAFIPNLVTLLNLAAGCLAIKFLFESEWRLAIICVGVSLLADFLDGAVARLLNTSSELGKQLDSLADVVSFGVVPGMMLYHLFSETFSFPEVGFLLSLMSALRLGKFNIDTRQTDQFIGLPTPACTIFVVGWVLIYQTNAYGLATWVIQPTILLILTVLLSYLLIAELPLFSLKFKHLGWKGNEIRFIFLIVALCLLLWLKAVGLVLIIILYVLSSLFLHLTQRSKA